MMLSGICKGIGHANQSNCGGRRAEEAAPDTNESKTFNWSRLLKVSSDSSSILVVCVQRGNQNNFS